MPIVHLRDEGWEPTAFFFNPNIHPAEEWLKRRDAMRDVSLRLNVPLLEEGQPVNPGIWTRTLGGTRQEGERCRFCYRPRLERTAQLAAAQGFDAFTSSLLYSRYQRHDVIREEAERAAAAFNASFLYRDFRPWWWDGIAMSRELGIYRQKWCGCILSMKEALLQQKERAARVAAEAEERRRKKEAIAAHPNKRARKAQKTV